ncbi:hypothetical protein PV05_10828 [Exophiala xenobiotica]|uniref:Nuclear fusion protein KAR5 n=1 Tax=Exophiala xenobiotica TaxID=348802 RepID=A0A0D2EMN7_9EURO|nr:uncharacterized protein PV05_10828 [Exophiala xenobiotica]KIW49119.1 hypothetical protein PV05_10828 [Exophiala xenobiotica]
MPENKMLPTWRYRGLWSTHLIVLTCFVFINLCQTKSFLGADLAWSALRRDRGNSQPDLTDLLAFRDMEQDPVFEKAMQVIDNLATQSTCHQTAAAQLLVTCKASGKSAAIASGKHELLERSKSVYAVRVAVCETAEGRAAVPAACSPVLEIPQRLQGEIDVVNSKSLAACLEALLVEHYYWTSYSNNRQDANTLCQASNLEASRLEALHSYQKLAELLPEFRQTLDSTRSEWLRFLKQQEEDARNINKLHQQNRAQLQEQHKSEMSAFHRSMAAAKEGLEDVSQLLHRSMAKTGSEVTQTHEALAQVLSDFATLRNWLAQVAQTTSENNAAVAAIHAKDMQGVHELALATTEVLKRLQAEEVIQDISNLLLQVKGEFDSIASAQSVHLASAERHVQLSAELSEAQKASLALGQEIRHISLSLASHLDTADAVAGRVSSRLDKVNQALSRVEKVSVMLSALSAVVAIPLRMIDQLHLRLFASFSMPAVILSFWKPRKYAYSLMAVYVFLESMISALVQYETTISTCFRRLGNQSRALSTFTFQSVNQNAMLALKAIGISIIIITIGIAWHCIAFTSRPPKSRVSRKAIAQDAFSDSRYSDASTMERRLRSGKRVRDHSPDRFRRAATVA